METPAETYCRLLGEPQWPGARSDEIRTLLRIFKIEYEPGTAEANIALQAALVANFDPWPIDWLRQIVARFNLGYRWCWLNPAKPSAVDCPLWTQARGTPTLHMCSHAQIGHPGGHRCACGFRFQEADRG